MKETELSTFSKHLLLYATSCSIGALQFSAIVALLIMFTHVVAGLFLGLMLLFASIPFALIFSLPFYLLVYNFMKKRGIKSEKAYVIGWMIITGSLSIYPIIIYLNKDYIFAIEIFRGGPLVFNSLTILMITTSLGAAAGIIVDTVAQYHIPMSLITIILIITPAILGILPGKMYCRLSKEYFLDKG
jgi:hypothetical protein